MTRKKEKNQFGIKGKQFLIPFVAVLIGTQMLVITLFMPFASATGDFKERLQEHSDEMYEEELDMTCGDVVNISLFEFGKIYYAAADAGVAESVSLSCVVIISAFAVMVVLTLLFAVFKKAMPIIIFDLLAFGVFSLIKWDFEDRGVLPSSNYDWGIARYIFYVGSVIAIVGAIALLVVKIKNKKLRNIQTQAE